MMLSCPAKAGHPVIAGAEDNSITWRLLDHPLSRMMTAVDYAALDATGTASTV